MNPLEPLLIDETHLPIAIVSFDITQCQMAITLAFKADIQYLFFMGN
jgi:hypothetical protein